jgi:outer membrane protein
VAGSCKPRNACKRTSVTIFASLLILSPVFLGAQEQTFDLAAAVRHALEHNNEIRAAANSVAAKEDDIGVARSQLLPRVFFEERYLRTNNPTYSFMAKLNQGRFTRQDLDIDKLNDPDPVNDYQTQFGIEQPIFAPRAWVGLDMSRREHEAGCIELVRKQEEIAFQVGRAWLLVHTTKSRLLVAEKGVEDAQEHHRIAKLRYEADLGMYADILRASTALTEAKQGRITAEKQHHLARRMLGLLLGLAGAADVAGQLPDFRIRPAEEYAEASRSRGDVRSLELRYENAVKNIRAAETGYLPDIGAGGSWQWNDPSRPFRGDSDSWQVSAFLRWNLFDGTRREYERAKAKHQARQVEERLAGAQKAVACGLYEAQLGLEEVKANRELAREALATAEEGARLVQMRYENAFSPIVDVLDVQVVLDRARAGLVARENEYRLAVLNLGWESGTLLQDLGITAEEKKD